MTTNTSFHVGVALPSSGTPDVCRAASAAEAAGLDGVWTGDHLVVGNNPGLDSPSILAAAAAVTSRVTVGWSVMLSALRPAVWAARQVATVQHICGGRLQLGIGIGQAGDEWRVAETSAQGRAARTDAFLAALPDLLAGRPGRPTLDLHAPAVTLLPSVAMPPLWIGGTSTGALERVLRVRGGWLASLLPTSALKAKASVLTSMASEQGIATPRVASTVFAIPTDGQTGSLSSAKEAAVEWLVSRTGVDARTTADIVISGPPDDLVEGLTRYCDAGAGTVVTVFAAEPLSAYDLLGRARALTA
jgi:alkanesulfonate monooxygenase SsuD/methylene tetrahydromethanopterin reductase-like flavin-dependent oxidoreductase (luciferase family)